MQESDKSEFSILEKSTWDAPRLAFYSQEERLGSSKKDIFPLMENWKEIVWKMNTKYDRGDCMGFDEDVGFRYLAQSPMILIV